MAEEEGGMKNTALLRKTPMKQAGFVAKVKPLSGLLRTANLREPKTKPKFKTRQRAVTPEEKLLWNRMASEIGCIACRIDGIYNSYVSIHHIDGRTKPGCHLNVLPLCAAHHQDDGSGVISVHPWKARFEAKYGVQAFLLSLVMSKLGAEK
jgi:hypothetical protein